MGLRTLAAPRIHIGVLAASLLGLVLAGLVPLVLLTRDRGGTSPATSTGVTSDLLYIEFGANLDTVWRASANRPERRERLLAIEHGVGFGIVPSLAPDHDRFVYTSLAANLKAVAPDVPAQVWLASLAAGSQPRQIADNADLLVKPVWSPDGSSIVFRRSTPSDYRLLITDLVGRPERELLHSSDAVFPIAYTPDGRSLYVARVRLETSELALVDIASGTVTEVGQLAAGLTRDWTLSPDGRSIAYLEMTYAGSEIVSRAFLIDTASGTRRATSQSEGSDFGPVWSAAGSVTIGQTQTGRTSEGVTSLAGKRPTGFDVPLGWAPDGATIAVRSFDGSSAFSPGNASLSILHSDGSRTTLTNKEATFLGWTNP